MEMLAGMLNGNDVALHMWLSMSGHTKESYVFNDTVKATFTLSNRDYFASWCNLYQTTNKIITMSQSQVQTLGVKEP